MSRPKVQTASADLYKNPRADYESEMRGPELPGVEPPSAPPAPIPPVSGPIDPNALDILKLIQGSKFAEPFVVTLMRKTGSVTHKTDAGTKTEDAYELCREMVREPSDLLRLVAGVQAGSFKHLNNITIEFQLLLYLAQANSLLTRCATSPAVQGGEG